MGNIQLVETIHVRVTCVLHSVFPYGPLQDTRGPVTDSYGSWMGFTGYELLCEENLKESRGYAYARK